MNKVIISIIVVLSLLAGVFYYGTLNGKATATSNKSIIAVIGNQDGKIIQQIEAKSYKMLNNNTIEITTTNNERMITSYPFIIYHLNTPVPQKTQSPTAPQTTTP